MSNRSRRDEDVFDMGRETPEGTKRTLTQRLDSAAAGESLSTAEIEALAHDVSEGLSPPLPEGTGVAMRFVPAEEINDVLEELFLGDDGEEYDYQHDGNAICPSCGGVFIQHYQFLVACRSNDIGQDDFVEICNPEDYFAFRETNGKLVVESPGGEQWEYCSYAHDGDIIADCTPPDTGYSCSHTSKHVIWNCRPISKKDPCDEEFMRSISS